MSVPPLLAAALLASLAQLPENRPALEGTALNALTSQPIPNVRVTLLKEVTVPGEQSFFTTYTDDQGRFRFNNLSPGAYRLTARKPSFFGDATGAPELLKVLPRFSAASGRIEIRLFPHSVIAGRILDDRGEPAQGAVVRALEVRKQNGHNTYTVRTTASTNDLGQYRLSWLTDGPHVLLISYEDYWIQQKFGPPLPRTEIERRYVPMFFPGVALSADAQSLHLRIGQDFTAPDVILRKQRSVSIRGRILGLQPGECGSVTVTLTPQDPVLSAQRISSRGAACQRDGEFEIPHTPAGAYELVALLNTPHKRMLAGATNVVVGQADLDGVQVTLAPRRELTGNLLLESSDFELAVWPDVHVSLSRPSEASPANESAGGLDGSFALHYVLLGHYQLSVRGTPSREAYLASILVGEQEYFDKPIDLTAGQPGPVRVIFRTDAGHLRSSLKPLESSTCDDILQMVMLPVDRARRTSRSLRQTQIDATGQAHFYQLPPGDYFLLALPLPLVNSVFRDNDLSPEMERAATRIRIDPRGQHEAQVNLYRPPQ